MQYHTEKKFRCFSEIPEFHLTMLHQWNSYFLASSLMHLSSLLKNYTKEHFQLFPVVRSVRVLSSHTAEAELALVLLPPTHLCESGEVICFVNLNHTQCVFLHILEFIKELTDHLL